MSCASTERITPDTTRLVQERLKRSADFRATGDFHQLSFQAMSTLCRVNFRTPDSALARRLQNEVLEWVGGFEARYSRFIAESLISRINDAAGKHWVEIDAETDALFRFCQDMFLFTQGVFDPSALPLLRLWNWKARPPVVPAPAAVQAARQSVGWGKVQRRPGAVFLPERGMGLDLGGVGKEYAVDRALWLVLEAGVQDVLVDFGQDVRVHGRPPSGEAWHIGLQDPKDLARCWTGVAVTNHAVATSGDVARFFVHNGRRYGHILDPRTGCPVDNGSLSVSVIASHCTVAGILSTTAFVLGPVEGIQLISRCPGAEGCVITNSTRHQTRGFHAYTTS